MAAVLKLTTGIVGKHNMLSLLVSDCTGLRIRKLAAGWQLQQEESAAALERNRTTADNTTTLTYSGQSCTINAVPKGFYFRMRSMPLTVELTYFIITEAIRLEFPPSRQCAHET